MDRAGLPVVAGALLLIFAGLSPFLFPLWFGADLEGFVAGLFFMVVAFIVGLVVIIVGLARSGRRHQQQQQQVVVVGAPGSAQARVKCPRCQHLNPVQARFCTQCAKPLESGAP